MYRDNDVGQAQFVKLWWGKVNYIIAFTEPTYDMIRVTNTNTLSLHLVYDMGDTTIEKVKVLFIDKKKKEKMSNHFFMMLCIKSWRIDGTKVTHHFNVWHTLWIQGNI